MKRLLVALVGSAVRFKARLVGVVDKLISVAVKNGLNIEEPRTWKANRIAATAPSWSSHDFLLLMNAASNRRATTHSSDNAPRASIIIPVFNNVEHTFQCLRSLIREIDFNETEIIVVNNASRDETEIVLFHLGDIVQVINNRENMGFVDACNQGAAVARGKYLVFLNNDTQVLPGWLKHLIDTVENDPSIGAVGSMLIYPDGSLQEAGAGVWKNGDAFRYGWGKNPEHRKYNFARQVDYCSAASLLVRKVVFDQLDGFDRRYAPAYYEDTDLCFSVRALGYKVIYQPMSRLIHNEGVTAGRDVQIGFKRFQTINQKKFVVKWREVLERDYIERDPALLDEAANRNTGPRIIIFDNLVPTPDRDSGSMRMFMLLKALMKCSRPLFVPLHGTDWPEYEKLLGKEGIETAPLTAYKKLLKERRFHAAILSHPDVASALLTSIRRADSRIKIIYDTVDLHFLRYEREHQLTGDSQSAEAARRYRKLETRLAQASDQVWCITSEDREVLESASPSAKIKVVPNIHSLQSRGKTFDERHGLLFIGGFLHRPNSDAVHYFITEIYPLVRQGIPDAKLYVVGGGVTPQIAAYDSGDVSIMGYVPDVGALFHTCRAFIAPLRYGAGMKGKVGQALSYGLPVVTTTIGAEGIGLTTNHEAMIADDPRAFAEAVVRVYRDRELWQRLSDNGYSHIEKHFTPQVVAEGIRDAIIEISEQTKLI
ncbi:MAG: glycosyltransferase [Pyrinomonadaceae bacterium]|nr:glycosyltransferase [Pyrinomonadaceae bacterium]